MADGDREDRIDVDDLRAQLPVTTLVPLRGEERPQSTFADDPLARLWRNAGNRQTGAEAIEAIRARRQLERDGSKRIR